MKSKAGSVILTVLLVIESIVLLMVFGLGYLHYQLGIRETEVFREKSDDGQQQVAIFEVGEPDWPFGEAHYRVYGPSNFYVDVADDGCSGRFAVEWKKDSVVITFSGSEQLDAVYELPFKKD